jgi:circadian clock protein KaiC
MANPTEQEDREAPPPSSTVTNYPVRTRVKTGIVGLDKMLSGGLLEGSTTLVRGAPGTGKTTLGMQFLYSGITDEDERGLLVSFEEFPFSLHRDALSLGWDLRKLEKGEKLRLIFTSPRIFLASLQSPESPLDRTIQEWDVRRVVLDSISHFTRMTRDPKELREIYNRVINGLKREGITSILTSEDSGTGLSTEEKGRLSFIVDNIILTRYVEIDSAMQRAILVLKTRGSNHAKEIRPFELREGGIVVGTKFEGREALLSGTPRAIAPGR